MEHTRGDNAKARDALRQTAVVIPVYAAPHIESEVLLNVLSDTVTGCLEQGVPPHALCLSVDGEDCGRQLAAALADHHKVMVTVARVNRGKLAAVRHGVDALQTDDRWNLVAVLDQDGDHFANDLVNLVRMANHLRSSDPTRRFMVLGERLSRHRPMGFLRGELEELADRILLDALLYHAAVSGKPLALEYQTALGEFPDFHSGFKLFDRKTAQSVFLAPPRICGASQDAYYRHAVEAVMTVEALMHGAILASVNRRTINRQPFTTFGVMDRCRLVADKMVWPLRRLKIPPAFISQWLNNHLGRLYLHTLVPRGSDEIHKIAAMVMSGCGADQYIFDGFEQPPFV